MFDIFLNNCTITVMYKEEDLMTMALRKCAEGISISTNPKFQNIISTPKELIILSQCEYLFRRDGEFSVTNLQWSKWVSVSIPTVIRTLRKFEELGYIKSRLAPLDGMANTKHITFCPEVVYGAVEESRRMRINNIIASHKQGGDTLITSSDHPDHIIESSCKDDIITMITSSDHPDHTYIYNTKDTKNIKLTSAEQSLETESVQLVNDQKIEEIKQPIERKDGQKDLQDKANAVQSEDEIVASITNAYNEIIAFPGNKKFPGMFPIATPKNKRVCLEAHKANVDYKDHFKKVASSQYRMNEGTKEFKPNITWALKPSNIEEISDLGSRNVEAPHNDTQAYFKNLTSKVEVIRREINSLPEDDEIKNFRLKMLALLGADNYRSELEDCVIEASDDSVITLRPSERYKARSINTRLSHRDTSISNLLSDTKFNRINIYQKDEYSGEYNKSFEIERSESLQDKSIMKAVHRINAKDSGDAFKPQFRHTGSILKNLMGDSRNNLSMAASDEIYGHSVDFKQAYVGEEILI